MKRLLLLMAALASLDASAADWRQYISQPAVDYFFDGDSVKRTPGAFEVVIRLREKPGDDLATRVAVDCKAATFRKLDVGLVEGERYVAKSAEVGGVLAVGKGFVAPLFQGWCIDWNEPAGAVWHEFGKSDSTTLYLDETPFKRNGDFERGIEADFTATVKSVGGGLEKLQRLRIDCRGGRYEPLGGVGRQAGVVSRIEPGPAAAIPAGSPPDMLKRLLCRKDAGGSGARLVSGPCVDIKSRLGSTMRNINLGGGENIDTCYQHNYDIKVLEDLKYEAMNAGCENYAQINDFIYRVQKAPCR